jgi:cytochrome c oxidase cbb3-type subunit 3
MSVRERDPLTGHSTTGHEWNGITELNTRVPRVIWLAIIVTHVWALVVWIMMPSWPLISTYTGGLLGIDQKEQVEEAVREAEASRAVWSERIAAMPIEEIRADAELMQVVGDTGPALFADNCAVCHGPDGIGGPGYPSLVDESWLWGGDPAAVMETIRVGINSTHPETRVAEMLAFGRDGILSREEILDVVAYVQSLSGGGSAAPETVAAGEEVFVANCVACHGEDGGGMTELGAPSLRSGHWTYGGDAATLFRTVHYGRRGWMPAWEGRLSERDRKILTAYVLTLGEEERQ